MEEVDVKSPVYLTQKDRQQIVDEMLRLNSSREKIDSMLAGVKSVRLLGYILIVLFFMDIAYVVYPTDFFNPTWEMRKMSEVLERLPVPFIGLVLIFWGGLFQREMRDTFLLWMTSWFCFWIGVIMFLGIPLAALNTFRVIDTYQLEMDARLQQQTDNANELITALRLCTNNAQVSTVMSRFSGKDIRYGNDMTTDQLRDKLLESIDRQQESLIEKIHEGMDEQVTALWKRLIRNVFTLILAGVFLLVVWGSSKWARDEWLHNR